MIPGRAIRTARQIFAAAAFYGVIVLLPLYFAEPMMARTGKRLADHPDGLTRPRSPLHPRAYT